MWAWWLPRCCSAWSPKPTEGFLLWFVSSSLIFIVVTSYTITMILIFSQISISTQYQNISDFADTLLSKRNYSMGIVCSIVFFRLGNRLEDFSGILKDMDCQCALMRNRWAAGGCDITRNNTFPRQDSRVGREAFLHKQRELHAAAVSQWKVLLRWSVSVLTNIFCIFKDSPFGKHSRLIKL